MPERLESARKRAGMYGTISAAVARELQAHEQEVAARKHTKQLGAEGVALVEWPQQGGWWNQEAKPLHHLPWVDAEAHATVHRGAQLFTVRYSRRMSSTVYWSSGLAG